MIGSGLLPRLSRRAWVILAGDALSALGTGLTLPFFIVYLSQVRGIGLGTAGLILSTVALAGLVGNPLGGWLVDRIGARRSVIVALVIAAAGSAALVLVVQAWHGFLVAGLFGIGMAILVPAEDALMATAVRPAQRPHVFALRHATLNIGLSLGALAAALVVALSVSVAGFAVLYLLDALSFLVYAVVLMFLSDVPVGPDDGEEPAPAGGGGYREVLRDRVFVRLWLLVLVLVLAGYAQYHAAFPAFATEVGGLSPAGLSIAFAANTVTVVVAQLLVLRLLAGHRRTRGLMLSAAFIAAAWVSTLVAAGTGTGMAGPVLFVVAMVLFGLGETLLSPTVPAIVNDLAPDRLRGRYNGAYTLAWTTGYIAGPAVAGLALAAGHGYGLFVVFVVILAGAVVGARLIERRLPAAINRIDPADVAAAPGTEQVR